MKSGSAAVSDIYFFKCSKYSSESWLKSCDFFFFLNLSSFLLVVSKIQLILNPFSIVEHCMQNAYMVYFLFELLNLSPLASLYYIFTLETLGFLLDNFILPFSKDAVFFLPFSMLLVLCNIPLRW